YMKMLHTEEFQKDLSAYFSNGPNAPYALLWDLFIFPFLRVPDTLLGSKEVSRNIDREAYNRVLQRIHGDIVSGGCGSNDRVSEVRVHNEVDEYNKDTNSSNKDINSSNKDINSNNNDTNAINTTNTNYNSNPTNSNPTTHKYTPLIDVGSLFEHFRDVCIDEGNRSMSNLLCLTGEEVNHVLSAIRSVKKGVSDETKELVEKCLPLPFKLVFVVPGGVAPSSPDCEGVFEKRVAKWAIVRLAICEGGK
ncbi:MAG: hypothetical protein QWI73_07030, partial [Alphaproteobacteria bacterium]|nr:hypothetical protein [Alphaproteobacteria bacterium]